MFCDFSVTHTHSLTQTQTDTHTQTHTDTHTHSHTHTHTHTHTYTHRHSQTHTHTHTHTHYYKTIIKINWSYCTEQKFNLLYLDSTFHPEPDFPSVQVTCKHIYDFFNIMTA